MNTFGEKFSFTSFGESHGKAIGGVLDGVPAGLKIDLDAIRNELDRRAGRSAQSVGTSPRASHEADEVEWLSGVIEQETDGSVERVSLGTPIAFIIRNSDARPENYEWLRHSYRTGHADRVYEQKYGIRDWRGGGRASARETAARVVAGCIAKQQLAEQGIQVHARLIQVGGLTDPQGFDEYIRSIQREGDSIGGIVECVITGLPVGIGEPIFNKLQAELAFAVMSINACKGFEYGTGFGGVSQRGSEINHLSGGIAGGISDGTEVVFRCVFKPTPSTPKALEQLRREQGAATQSDHLVSGRHDACVAVRAVPVVEAMAAMAVANLL